MNSYEIKNKSIALRFQFIELGNKEVLFLDYSHANRDECFALTQEFEHYLQDREADGSLRILFNIDSPYYDPAHLNHWRENSMRYEKYFYATALYHVSPIFKLMLFGIRAYVKMMGGTMNKKRGRVFEDKTAALEFLIQD